MCRRHYRSRLSPLPYKKNCPLDSGSVVRWLFVSPNPCSATSCPKDSGSVFRWLRVSPNRCSAAS